MGQSHFANEGTALIASKKAPRVSTSVIIIYIYIYINFNSRNNHMVCMCVILKSYIEGDTGALQMIGLPD